MPSCHLSPVTCHCAAAPAAALPVDSHTHTRLCRHASGLPLDYARAALAAGCAGIVCTDHVPFPDDPSPAIRMTADDFPRYLDLVAAAQTAPDLPPGFVRLGLEADFHSLLLPDWLPAILDRAPFDLVLGSIHTGPHWDMHPGDPRVTPSLVLETFRAYFRKMVRLAQSGLFDACAHFDLPKRTGLTIPLSDLREIALPALDAVAAAGMAVEINTSGCFHPAGEPYPSLPILQWMHERSIPILFGSDAHRPSDVAQRFPDALSLARSAGYSAYSVFTRRTPVSVPF